MEQGLEATRPVATNAAQVTRPTWLSSMPEPTQMVLHVVLMLAAIPVGVLGALFVGGVATNAIGDSMCTDPEGYCLAILPGILIGLAVFGAVGAAAASLTNSLSRRSLLFGGYVTATFLLVAAGDLNAVWHQLGL